MSAELGLWSHAAFALHEMGAGHPESPHRVVAVARALEASGLSQRAKVFEAPRADREALARVHTDLHIDTVSSRAPTEGYVQLDPDTALNPHSLEAAERAAGAVVAAVDWVMESTTTRRRAFCNVRPPGHHAVPTRAMGFCIFNSIAVGAMHAREAHKLERVCVVDFDVHHGNGTEEMLAAVPGMLMLSTFQHPYYPHCGVPELADNIISVPLAWGSGSKEVRAAFTQTLLPALDAFAPELILISAGFDAHAADDMAGLNFQTDDYAWMTQHLVVAANKHCAGRIVSSLEGGYNLRALADSAVAHVQALAV